ncbi:MAG TPA: antibiotic biosynthesis monooxygenase [Rummeliibacillus sp.]|nr:antibiotic biosynthesis monooxygenase [Rummeliibacillus sp.]
MNLTAKTPEPPYYAVIFTSQREEADNGYAEMAKRMEELATKQEGFLGIESARDNELGITVSYWDSLEAIKNWKNNASHEIAQKRGKEEWYQNYHVRISKVERDYFID